MTEVKTDATTKSFQHQQLQIDDASWEYIQQLKLIKFGKVDITATVPDGGFTETVNNLLNQGSKAMKLDEGIESLIVEYWINYAFETEPGECGYAGTCRLGELVQNWWDTLSSKDRRCMTISHFLSVIHRILNEQKISVYSVNARWGLHPIFGSHNSSTSIVQPPMDDLQTMKTISPTINECSISQVKRKSHLPTAKVCRQCGSKTHRLAKCVYAHHPDCNHTENEWKDSQIGKTFQQYGYQQLVFGVTIAKLQEGQVSKKVQKKSYYQLTKMYATEEQQLMLRQTYGKCF